MKVIKNRWIPGFIFLIAAFSLAACDEEKSLCEEQLAFEKESCGLVTENAEAWCSNANTACYTKCMAGATCKERAAVYIDGENPDYPRWRCFLSCREGVSCDGKPQDSSIVRCDGFMECLDGLDEKGCQYHTCADGQNVAVEAYCNGYADCADGSDEINCGGKK
ncbi:MAG: LDL receptor domain-containing protein [Deltaproteobacteria bacterium]|nr:LDL receptor domain-containing protein [Deltaproteobacteria bacterium]